MNIRASGVLLPIFSLPSPFGIGDLGPWACRFADMLSDAGQHVWQILPLNPTLYAHGDSPYHSPSAFAFNPLLISPEWMADDGFIEKKDLNVAGGFPEGRIDYRTARQVKEGLLDKALTEFRQSGPNAVFERFCHQNAGWLDDFALFEALRGYFEGTPWNRWSSEIRDRAPEALHAFSEKLSHDVLDIKFLQFLFFTQWRKFKQYCNERSIHIFGDIPIYIPHDSADVWTHPDLFKLDPEKNPVVVSGVPPDYFSAAGQLWGHPVYHWEMHRKRRYDWWIRRLSHNLTLLDYIRIDHFRGLVAYWEVPAGEKTAVNGRWVPVPTKDFIDEMLRTFPCLPIIAEDLGYITADVREIMNTYRFPGMRLLVFGFADAFPDNPNAPHNIPQNSVVYTGTHDTNTVGGWFEEEATRADKHQLFRYLGRRVSSNELPWELIRLALMSPARLSIIPMQDILSLGSEARMNRPAGALGNWQWRLTKNQMESAPMDRLRELTKLYDRA